MLLRMHVKHSSRSIAPRGAVFVNPYDDSRVIAGQGTAALERAKLVVEPSGAVPLAVLLEHPENFHGRRVGLVLSGGNVDLERLPW